MIVTEAIALEHATLLRVFDEVERVLPGVRSAAEVGRMAAIVEGLLRTHAQLEVDFAFVPLDHALKQKGRLATLHQDHRELNERLRRVREARTCEQARELLLGAMRASREHFDQEERKLFPVLERALGLAMLAAFGEAFKRATKAEAKRARPAGRGR